jgi:hypothetical protein
MGIINPWLFLLMTLAENKLAKFEAQVELSREQSDMG